MWKVSAVTFEAFYPSIARGGQSEAPWLSNLTPLSLVLGGTP
jgi:hypothetical protein